MSERVELPCGKDASSCCQLARSHGANAFQLNDAGCCSVFRVDAETARTVLVPPFPNFYSAAAGAGLLF